MNNVVTAPRVTNFNYLIAIKNCYDLINKLSNNSEEVSHSVEETFEILMDFQGRAFIKVENMDERVNCAYKLLSAVDKKTRGDLLYTLYEKTIENDMELLKEIAESKYSESKTDSEISELIKKTSLFKLERYQEYEVQLTNKEYARLKDNHKDIRATIDLVRQREKHFTILNE